MKIFEEGIAKSQQIIFCYSYSILSGILVALACPPFDLYYLAWIALIPLFLVIEGKGLRDTLLLFASTGITILIGWYYSALAFSVSFFFLLVILFATVFVVFGWVHFVLCRAYPNPGMRIFGPPVIWTGIEQLYTNTVIGFPVNLGITQGSQPLLIQSASLFGIFGISFLIVLSNTSLSWIIVRLKNYKKGRAPQRSWVPLCLSLLLVVGNLVYGWSVLSKPLDDKNRIPIATIQPVIPTEFYLYAWINPGKRDFLRRTFDDLTRRATETKAKMIIWPEGGNGYYNLRIPELRDNIYRTAIEKQLDFIVASDDIDPEGFKTNSVFSISPQGKLLGRYDKVRLVPIAEKDYTPGKKFIPLPTTYGLLGTSICFESCFPSISRELTRNGANLLLFSVSDAVFRKSALTLNHARVAVFRAVENDRYVVRAANTGPSMVISPRGEILQQSHFYKREIMEGTVSFRATRTFYSTFGYYVPWLMALVTLLLFIATFLKVKKEIHRPKKKRATRRIKKRTTKHIDQRILWGRLVFSWNFILLHLFVLLVLVPVSIYFVNQTTKQNTTFAQALGNFLSPPMKPNPEGVTQKFLQASKNTCGPAALAYLLSYYGRDTLEESVLARIHLQEKGTSMYDLAEAAKVYGFKAWGEKQNFAALKHEVKPVIAFINNDHYVVLIKIRYNQVELFDPAIGHILVPRQIFEQIWDGYVLIVRVNPIQKQYVPEG